MTIEYSVYWFTFHGPDKQLGSENGAFGAEQKSASSRSGLVERMVARASYNAPRLNTDVIRPPPDDVDKQSSVLTIPPGLSPTSLLDSPVFLSNSLAQPSPTTGKFTFAQNKDDSFKEFNNSSFAFKPVLESASVPVSNKVVVNLPFMFWQSEDRVPSQSIETAKNGGLNGNIVQEHHEEYADQIPSGEVKMGITGESMAKNKVKGSEYPRSYYKCTYANRPVTKRWSDLTRATSPKLFIKGPTVVQNLLLTVDLSSRLLTTSKVAQSNC
ncbi:putative transcription factor WRKY family [Helianthus anomalus]